MDETQLEQMKSAQATVWGLGDYPKIARLTDQAAVPLVDACAISAGQEVLDVAAGTGNVAIRAANEGAAVTATDLSPGLVDLGKARSAEEGVDIDWSVADVEDLPFEDACFDCVTSVFGAMFAPRPAKAIEEMFRVVRPGNTVGMSNWTPDSMIARSFGIIGSFFPPPEGVPSPFEWGDEATARERFEPHAGTVEIERHRVDWRFGSREEGLEFFENAGPQAAMKANLDPDTYAQMTAKQLELIDELNAADEGVVIDSEFLVVVGRKRG
ncbi:MAG: class I SAM-dependent methyltransferase [Thermoleophilaceae bacterium]|nr:class I SAM-dependent methyltransferase [Thermoleophilaceae bacterium]